MLYQKAKCFEERTVSLNDLVPPENFYRRLEAKLDLCFVYELVKDVYAPSLGRPSIDPLVFFKLHLILFFEGIRSERRLMEIVNVNLAHRWYIGYDLDEPVPDHSSLSKIRTRYGLAIFERFFEHVIELCRESGLVWGEELYFDSTNVRANAAIASLIPREEWEARQHVQVLFAPEGEPAKPAPEVSSGGNAVSESSESTEIRPEELVEKYDGSRLNEKRTSSYKRTTDRQVSSTDPEASPMKRSTGDQAHLGYHNHYVVDGGKDRIILADLVTPASVMDNTPMLDLLQWVCSRWNLKPSIAVGDAKYGTVANIVGLESQGIHAYLPTSDLSQRTEFYPPEEFQYDSEQDQYICPQGQQLRLYSRRQREEMLVYRADATTCNQCPVKAKCTQSRSGRHLFRSFDQEHLDRVHAYPETESYQKAMRKRRVWVEPLFAEVKQWHQGARFRLRRLKKVNIEGLLTAAGLNLKHWLGHQERKTA
jgi:transposase